MAELPSNLPTHLHRAEADTSFHLSDSEESIVLSDSEENNESSAAEDDVTAWRAGEDEGDADALDSRVAGAFDALNAAVARNNEVEAAHAAAQRQLQATRAEGKALLAPLERRHARQLKKIERFKAEQAAAQREAERLRRLSTDLHAAREVLGLANEALDLQRLYDPCDRDAGWDEAEAKLKERKAEAEAQVSSLARQRRRCAAETEKRTRRVVEQSAAIGDVAADAMPLLAKQASVELAESTLEASVKARSEATAKAKADVKEAMTDLERISLDIQRQEKT